MLTRFRDKLVKLRGCPLKAGYFHLPFYSLKGTNQLQIVIVIVHREYFYDTRNLGQHFLRRSNLIYYLTKMGLPEKKYGELRNVFIRKHILVDKINSF